jgi:hypothetical protein
VIVLDEQLEDPRIFASIQTWYRGRVVGITSLRPATVIKDDAIPGLLLRARQPCFVTINVSDFWRRVAAHPAYSIVTIELPLTRKLEVPEVLRRVFRSDAFRTHARRAGKVLRARASAIEFYDRSGAVQSVIGLI